MKQNYTTVIGSWQQLAEQAAAVRHEVFVQEQQVPIELELDEDDAVAVHALALDGATAMGTGRLLPDAHIGRMAVLAAYRGQGVGTQLLMALVNESQRRGDRWVVLAAQCQAQGFYRRHGFVAEGEVFLDAGIQHVLMRKVF